MRSDADFFVGMFALTGLVAMFASCAALTPPSTLNEGIAYSDAIAGAVEKTLGQISCPHQLDAAKHCMVAGQPVPNAILDPRDALSYSANLTTLHVALKALPSMPSGGGACLPALPATVTTPAQPAQNAANPGSCLVMISGLLTMLQTTIASLH